MNIMVFWIVTPCIFVGGQIYVQKNVLPSYSELQECSNQPGCVRLCACANFKIGERMDVREI
jgi:hypothetical protein